MEKVAEKSRTIAEKISKKIVSNFAGNLNSRVSTELDKITAQINRSIQSAHARWFKEGEVDVLPELCRYFHKKGNLTTFVIEQKPSLRRISVLDRTYNPETNVGDEVRSKLSFPYVIFVICFSRNNPIPVDFRVFFRTSPLSKPDNELFAATLANMVPNGEGRVCLNDIFESDQFYSAQKLGVSKLVSTAIALYWSSLFNADYLDSLKEAEYDNPGCFFPIKQWEDKSQEDAMFALHCSYRKVASLDEVVRQTLEGAELDIHRDIFDKKDLLDEMKSGIQEDVDVLIDAAAEVVEGDSIVLQELESLLGDVKQVRSEEQQVSVSQVSILKLAEELIKLKLHQLESNRYNRDELF